MEEYLFESLTGDVASQKNMKVIKRPLKKCLLEFKSLTGDIVPLNVKLIKSPLWDKDNPVNDGEFGVLCSGQATDFPELFELLEKW